MATGYSAAKHGVVGLSLSLRAEAAAYGVEVSVLCPGVVRTPILDSGGKFGRVTEDVSSETQAKLWDRLRPTDVNQFAGRVLDDIARNKAVIIHPRWWRILWALGRWSPWFSGVMSRRLVKDARKLIEDEKAARSSTPGS